MQKLTIVTLIMAALLLLCFTADAKVFFEVATASYCPDCYPANKILFDLYRNYENPFYYVMMVGDKNEFAYDRIKSDYNFYWYPTVFVDGGYRVVLEASKEAYKKAIEESMNREKPDIYVAVNASWIECPCQHGLAIDVNIKNNEDRIYRGVLRVYIVEVNSRWDDYMANQYHFAFLEFAYVGNISLAPYEEMYIPTEWNPEIHFPDINRDDVNNLAVFAVIFNKTSHIAYANPPDKNPFKAYYVDAIASYIPENFPPSVSILSPKNGYLYLFDREIIKIGKTVIIGSKSIYINAYDESGIDRVEIYVDGELKATLKNSYTWIWKDFGIHTLEAKAYDKMGYSASDYVKALIIA